MTTLAEARFLIRGIRAAYIAGGELDDDNRLVEYCLTLWKLIPAASKVPPLEDLRGFRVIAKFAASKENA